jgi:hypothetical protein
VRACELSFVHCQLSIHLSIVNFPAAGEHDLHIHSFRTFSMSLAVFSLTLGVFCYAAGFPMVMNDRKHIAWRKKLLSDDNVIRALSVALAVIALATLKMQWEVTPDGEGVMVFLAWLLLLESAFMLLFPSRYGAMKLQAMKVLMPNDATQSFFGFVAILVGALLTYMGLMLP